MNNIFLIIMIVLCITMIIIAISLFFSEQNLKNEIEKLRYNMKNDSLDNLSKTKDVLNQKFIEIIKENQDQTNILSNSISVSLKEIRESNEKKLTEIQANVNEKLDKS
ncbi:MAG: hypothetical protein Q4F88_03130, partial [Eubacteriales bacterium]|nr:hypothetical protein [Eubacteriales bacterium]